MSRPHVSGLNPWCHDAHDGELAAETVEDDAPEEEGTFGGAAAVVAVEEQSRVVVAVACEVPVHDATRIHLYALPALEQVAGPSTRDRRYERHPIGLAGFVGRRVTDPDGYVLMIAQID